MFFQYEPKNFGKEYCDLVGSGQYPMFVATALDAKLCFDDWIPIRQYETVVNVCKEYNLHVEPDVVFVKVQKKRSEIIGGENITTTFTEVRPFDKKINEGNVHVFIARSKEQAIETKRYGWYPGIINNRSLNKPFVDHLRFGRNLGFPKCCVDFFRKYNNWRLYSHPYETYKNTLKMHGKPAGSYLCNNFLMDRTFFLIHHLPCSYRCGSTIELAQRVEDKILEVEPEFVKKTVELLKKPLLVFGERNFIQFEGEVQDNKIIYSDSIYCENPARIEDKIEFFDKIKEGNQILLDDEKLNILKNENNIANIPRKKEWFILDFE